MAGDNFIEKFRTRITRVLGIALILLLAFGESRWEITWEPMEEILASIGLFFVTIAALGRMWCSLYIAGYKTVKLVTQGPYSLCRNPLYVFSFIGAVGMGLGSATFTVPAVIMAAFLIYYPLTIKSEEGRLSETHGPIYDDYCRNTNRYWPSFRSYSEPQTYIVEPRLYRKHMMYASLWILLFGLWEIFELLREIRIIPVLFKLW